jgi:hypothetical protein
VLTVSDDCATAVMLRASHASNVIAPVYTLLFML